MNLIPGLQIENFDVMPGHIQVKFSYLIAKCEWLRLCLTQFPKICKLKWYFFKWKALAPKSHLAILILNLGLGNVRAVSASGFVCKFGQNSPL